jgi:hypothetical protein
MWQLGIREVKKGQRDKSENNLGNKGTKSNSRAELIDHWAGIEGFLWVPLSLVKRRRRVHNFIGSGKGKETRMREFVVGESGDTSVGSLLSAVAPLTGTSCLSGRERLATCFCHAICWFVPERLRGENLGSTHESPAWRSFKVWAS